MRKSILAVVLLSDALLGKSHGQTVANSKCEAPAVSVTSSVTEYALKKYHIPSATQLLLQESTKENDDCYWKYRYQVASPRREIVLYLAPDHRYLTTTLYDRTSDPLGEEKLQRDEMMKTLTAAKSPSRGPQGATVTLVEFSDFECPYCQRLTNILEQDVLPSDSDIRVIFKNYPLAMHPWARPAAQVIACAAMQNDDAFWKLHDYAFSNQKDFTIENVEERLTTFADQQTGIDHKAFHDCMDRGLTVGPVMKDEELGRKEGVHATPTIFINGTRLEGIRDAAQLKQLIASARSGDLTPALTNTSQVSASPQGNASAAPIRKGGNDGPQ